MPKLILLPGLDGTGRLFAPFISELSQGCDADEQFDSMSISYPDSLEFTWSSYADHVSQRAGEMNGAWLLAESFSGPVALELINRFKPQLAGLILVASFATPPRPWLLRCSKLLPINWFFQFPPPAFLLRVLLTGAQSSQNLIQELRNAIRSVAPNSLSGRLRMLNATPNLTGLSIQFPCIYLQASRDRLLESTSYDGIRSIIPCVIRREIDSAHLVLQSQPTLAAEAIRGFVRETSGRATDAD